MADFMCTYIQSSLHDIFFCPISCVSIFSQAFMADLMCMHIQSSLHGRFFWQFSCVYHIQSSLHGRFNVFAYSVKPLWQISCVCIFSQAIMTDFFGRFHLYAYSVKPSRQISCVWIFSQAFMADFSGRSHVYAYSVKPSWQIFLADFMSMHIQSSFHDRFFISWKHYVLLSIYYINILKVPVIYVLVLVVFPFLSAPLLFFAPSFLKFVFHLWKILDSS